MTWTSIINDEFMSHIYLCSCFFCFVFFVAVCFCFMFLVFCMIVCRTLLKISNTLLSSLPGKIY